MERKLLIHHYILMGLLFVVTTLAVIKDTAMEHLTIYMALYGVGLVFTTLHIVLYLRHHRHDEDFFAPRTIYLAIASCVTLLLFATGITYLALRYGIHR